MQPFQGIKVVDLTHVLAGPFATYQLALFGADVIKIEMPLDPDQTRLLGADKDLARSKMNTFFLAQGSNKRSMTVDLKTEAGRDILRRLVRDADIMVENYRPGAMKAMGLGYEDMAAINQRLIYASMSAVGQEGPPSTQPGYEPNIQAASRLMAATGTPEGTPRLRPRMHRARRRPDRPPSRSTRARCSTRRRCTASASRSTRTTTHSSWPTTPRTATRPGSRPPSPSTARPTNKSGCD